MSQLVGRAQYSQHDRRQEIFRVVGPDEHGRKAHKLAAVLQPDRFVFHTYITHDSCFRLHAKP